MKRATVKNNAMLSGKIKWFNPKKGFGFIIPDIGGSDVYLPVDTLKNANVDAVEPGCAVRYTLATEEGRAFAASILLAERKPESRKFKASSDLLDPYSEFEEEWGLKPV